MRLGMLCLVLLVSNKPCCRLVEGKFRRIDQTSTPSNFANLCLGPGLTLSFLLFTSYPASRFRFLRLCLKYIFSRSVLALVHGHISASLAFGARAGCFRAIFLRLDLW
ncbi:hypothetical protein EV356DRAFT_342303 [Viridothelium virens]|uniref:Secreted protein n=1 Tax=Viridothelium virens TaxID=1048519 RepID=A0A6A6GXW1_VIRVR|nr:hypothetical protein EV356DRAFT_342303 [Viridothelium virens]